MSISDVRLQSLLVISLYLPEFSPFVASIEFSGITPLFTYPSSAFNDVFTTLVPCTPNTGRVLIIHNRGDWRSVMYLSNLMYYPTRHCTPSSSTSFFMVFHAVCCSSASTRNASLLVNTSAGIRLARALHFQGSNCKASVQNLQRQRTFCLFCM